jgi:hypothetical protein
MKRDDIELKEQPLFGSAAAAAAFALNFDGQNYQKPAISQLITFKAECGKGLGGLDGAAQSGMIRAELAAIGLIGEAVIVADVAPKSRPCHCRAPCCCGEITNPEWAAAIGFLSNVAKEMKICPSYMNVRSNLLRRFFGVSLEITEIARMCGVSRETVSIHNSKLVSAFKLLKKKAWADFDHRLLQAGMIEK